MTRALVALALASLLAAPAAAQTPPAELEARALFEAGEAAVAERRFEDAQRLFERSLELHPTAAAAFNAAVAAHEAGALPAAARQLDALLDATYGPLPEARADGVRRLRAEIVAALGTLVVRSDREGLRATVGDEARPVAPEATFYLTPGPHTLRLEGPEGPPRERAVELTAGERRVIDLVVEARVERSSADPGPGPDPAPDTGPDVGLIVGVTVGALLAVGVSVLVGVIVHESQQLPDEFLGRTETLIRF